MEIHRSIVRFVPLFAIAMIALLALGIVPAARAADADATYALETAVDAWIPFVIWGGLLVFCLYLAGEHLSAWFPAAAALLNLTANLPAPAVYSREAAIMLFLVAFMTHALTVAIANFRRRTTT